MFRETLDWPQPVRFSICCIGISPPCLQTVRKILAPFAIQNDRYQALFRSPLRLRLQRFLALVLIDHALRHRGQNADVKESMKAVPASAGRKKQKGEGRKLEDPDPLEA